jgi:hypothetical protein
LRRLKDKQEQRSTNDDAAPAAGSLSTIHIGGVGAENDEDDRIDEQQQQCDES